MKQKQQFSLIFYSTKLESFETNCTFTSNHSYVTTILHLWRKRRNTIDVIDKVCNLEIILSINKVNIIELGKNICCILIVAKGNKVFTFHHFTVQPYI